MALLKYFLVFFSSTKQYLIAVMFGSLIFLTFPPYNIHALSILSFGYLIFIYPKLEPKQALITGLCFGLGMFGFSVSWVYISIHEYGHVHHIFASLITLALIVTLSIFIAIHGYYVNKFSSKSYLLNIIIFSCIWTLLEWLRGWVLTGFPWLYIGYTQAETIYGAFLPIVGVFGTSFITIFLYCLIAHILINIKKIKSSFLAILLILLVTLCSYTISEHSWTKRMSTPISVSLIQANIDQNVKWNRNNLHSTLQLFFDLTKSSLDSDLIIWPESAIPLVKKNATNFLATIEKLAEKNKTGVILGILITEQDKIYNGIIGIGESHGQYLKQYLVPFGEFIPFKPFLEKITRSLNFPLGDLQHGTPHQKNLIYGDIEIAPFICYEVAYAKSFLDFRKNAQIFLTVSNDAWFGESIALDQHLQMAQARARQAGKYHLVSTNTGLTAIINNHGKIIHHATPFQITVLDGEIYAMQGLTPWSRIGYAPLLFIVFIILLFTILFRKFKYVC